MEESEYRNLAALETTHWWYVGMAAISADWLKRLPQELDVDSVRVLDAGCGTGGAFRWLTQFGRLSGVDRSPLALQCATHKGCQELVRADVCALPFADESFSILTSFDVLYHQQVTNDWTAIREFKRVLRPGGWLLLRLPAHNWLRGGHDRVVHTARRYTCREVHAKLATLGLQPLRVSYVNTLLFLPAALWRLFQRGRPVSDLRLPPRLVNTCLTALLRAERAWLRRWNLPVGLSVIALARKELQ